MSFAVPVLEMCLDVLYFHSCGIVGIMMVMIKLAHLCAVLLCLFIIIFFKNCMLNVSCGVLIRRREGGTEHKALRSPFIQYLECLCKKKKKKKKYETNKAHLTTLHATVHTM